MPFGADVVPDECMTIAMSSASALAALVGRVLGDQLVQRVAGSRSDSSSTSGAACSHLAISFSPPKPTIAFARVWPTSAESCADVEHRRQRREHDAAVQAAEHRDRGLDRVAAEQHDHVARLHRAGGQPRGQRDGGAAQLVVGDAPVVEDQRDLVRAARARAREVAPQVARSPVPSA